MLEDEIIELNVTPAREFYYDENGAFGIYAVEPDNPDIVQVNKKYNTITIKGSCARLDTNKSYHVKLLPKQDKRYGMGYEIQSIYEDMHSKNGQEAFLLSVLTPLQVQHLLEAYPNQDIVTLIKNDQIDINKVRGIGKKNIESVKKHVMANLENQKAFEYLKKYNLTNRFINKLVNHFGSADLLIQKMDINPYVITEVNGVGFLRADPLALKMGVSENSPYRIRSAIYYILEEEASSGGHTYMTVKKVLDRVNELTHINYDRISDELSETKGIKIINDRVTINKYYDAEKYISERLISLLHHSTKLKIDIEQFISDQEKELKCRLTDQQKKILINITNYNVNVLAGFAGSGKSFVNKFIIRLLDKLKIKYQLVSPTAKAAKVLSSYTGKKAVTIHRSIGIKGEFQKQEEDNIITSEFLLIDEASMTDVMLCFRLLKDCVNPNLRILFVGDPAQLPSVNCGQILLDIINSLTIPTVKLDKIFRQKEGGILDKATKIRNGQTFLENDFAGIKQFGEDLTVASVPQNKIVGGYKYFYRHYLNYYKPSEITIVTPTKKAQIGTVAINQDIQEIVNPASKNKEEYLCKYTGVNFREGDYVLNSANNYKDFFDTDHNQVEVINGDSGRIIEINNKERYMIVELDNIPIIFPFKFINQLMHAWCLTVAKMQGSSNRAIIFIADKANTFSLSRNLIYTAVTRPTKQLVVLTQAETLNRGIRRKTDMQRRTWLKEMLIEMNNHVDKAEDNKKD